MYVWKWLSCYNAVTKNTFTNKCKRRLSASYILSITAGVPGPISDWHNWIRVIWSCRRWDILAGIFDHFRYNGHNILTSIQDGCLLQLAYLQHTADRIRPLDDWCGQQEVPDSPSHNAAHVNVFDSSCPSPLQSLLLESSLSLRQTSWIICHN